jgi:tellurite resistance-related uncharacterized protein
METKKSPKKSPFFSCNVCDYNTCKKSDYEKHLSTRKHDIMVTMETEETKKSPKVAHHNMCCKCKKKYNTRAGLWKHMKLCDYTITVTDLSSEQYENEENIIKIDNLYNISNKDEILIKLIKDNDEMMKIIKGQQEQINSIIPKIGSITNNMTNTTNNNNTTNNFNLNVFLNEYCKDALNISDFIDSLKITLEDLLFSKTNGISRGITDVMIKGLKELDIHKRPIHCTDIKRDIMYIKDEDKWSKDENHEMMKNTIVKIADKERTALQQWAIDNPDWIETERKQLDYLTMVRSICEPIENYDNYEKKILKNLGKEIQIDKKN